MIDWLANLSQPHATLAASIVTVGGALGAIWLGSFLFGGKVTDLKSAISATDALVKQHQDSIANALEDIALKIGGLAVSTGQLRSDVADSQATIDSEDAEGSETEAPAHAEASGEVHAHIPEVEQPHFETFADHWAKIRDTVEEIAANPSIDGRTSAKYARIDRRKYMDLINSLDRDGNLGPSGDAFREATNLWSAHRTKRRQLTAESAARMRELAEQLTQS